MNTVCSQCNAPMSCDPGHGCWCSGLLHALPVPDEGTTGCLCRERLTTLKLPDSRGGGSLNPVMAAFSRHYAPLIAIKIQEREKRSR